VLAKYHAQREPTWDAELHEAKEAAVMERMLKATGETEPRP
jgi:hypothetical protein